MGYGLDVERTPLFAVRYPKYKVDTQEFTTVSVYTDSEIITYKPCQLNALKLEEDRRETHEWGEVPVTEYSPDRYRMSGYEDIIPLIDLYDAAQSDTANYMSDLNEATLVITGDLNLKKYSVKDLAEMKKANLMLLASGMNSDGSRSQTDAKYVYKQYDVNGAEAYKNRLQKDIHKISFVPDLTDDSFSGTQSGEAMKYKLFGFQQMAKTGQCGFKKGLTRRYRLLMNMKHFVNEADHAGLGNLVITFTPNLPKAILEELKALVDAGMEISQETLMGLASFIEDIQVELERIQNEKEKERDDAVMKVNRLELLKARIGLEMVSGFDELQKFCDKKLTDRTLDEFQRQAGILGKTIKSNGKAAHAIVNASFHNAKFSDRIWMYQDMLKNELNSLLQTGLIRGQNARKLAVHLRKRFGVSQSNAERLMITELARVQTEAQKQSFERNGFAEYEFIALGDACPICKALDGKHFKVAKMMPGMNAPPMHPRCRCSVSAYEDSDEYEAWLDFLDRGGTTEEWENQKPARNLAKAIYSMYSISEDGRETYTREEIIEEMQKSPIGRKAIDWIENSDVHIAIHEDDDGNGNRGEQTGKIINLYPQNIGSVRIVAQTLIHEMGHYHYHIGYCQHAEAICFGLEKLHLTGKEKLTVDEWEYVKKLAIDNYPEFKWEDGGYGNYKKIKIVDE